MMRAVKSGSLVAALCVAALSPAVARAAAPRAAATLLDAGGRTVGVATIRQMPLGLKLTVKATGLPPGVHGVHLHAIGACAAPDFKSAGGHWNPTMKQHGRDNPAGMHMGDLPNLTIAADGTGRLRAFVPHARLTGGDMPLLDGDGAALVIHAGRDDYRSDPAGDSGARIACGAIAAD